MLFTFKTWEDVFFRWFCDTKERPMEVSSRCHQLENSQYLFAWRFQKWLLFWISYMRCHPSHWRTPSFFGVGLNLQPAMEVGWENHPTYPLVDISGSNTSRYVTMFQAIWILMRFPEILAWNIELYIWIGTSNSLQWIGSWVMASDLFLVDFPAKLISTPKLF